MADRQHWASTHWVEIDLDYVDQLAARAEYTLIFIGPARMRMINSNELWSKFPIYKNVKLEELVAAAKKELKAFGMAQGVSISVSRQRIPVMEIGSELMALASGQTSFVQASIQRLVADSPSFLKRVKEDLLPDSLKDTVPEGSIDFSLHGKGDKWPFGMGFVFYADLTDGPIGRIYLEHCKVAGIGSQVAAGQTIMYEGVTVIGHRALEFNVSLLPPGVNG